MEGVKDQRLCLEKSGRGIGREARISGRRHQEKECYYRNQTRKRAITQVSIEAGVEGDREREDQRGNVKMI